MTTITRPEPGQSAPWLEGIEGSAAQELIESQSKVIRVVAGPGSGKTTCLKRRIQRLVLKNRVNPETIFVGTFTRAIAGELRDALGTQVKVSTLHSLAYELLLKHPAACQGMRLRFLLKYEEDAMLYDVAEGRILYWQPIQAPGGPAFTASEQISADRVCKRRFCRGN